MMTVSVEKNHELILMAGLPGAGKTTLAYQLKNILPCSVLDKDLLKDILLLAKIEDEKAGWLAFELLFVAAKLTFVWQRLFPPEQFAPHLMIQKLFRNILVGTNIDDAKAVELASKLCTAIFHEVFGGRRVLILDSSALHPFILKRSIALAQEV